MDCTISMDISSQLVSSLYFGYLNDFMASVDCIVCMMHVRAVIGERRFNYGTSDMIVGILKTRNCQILSLYQYMPS